MQEVNKNKEVQAYKRLLAMYERLLNAVAKASNQLIVVEEIPHAISRALQVFGEAIQAKRVYIFQYHPHPTTGEEAMSMRYEWVSKEAEPAIHDPDEQNLTIREAGTAQVIEQLKAGQIANLDVEKLPPVSRKRFAEKQIKSHQLIPIVMGKDLWGFFGIMDGQVTKWSDVNEGALRTVASNFSAALKSLEEYEKRKESEAKFLDTVENVPGVIYQWMRRKDGSEAMNYVSPKLYELFGIESEAAKKDVHAIVDCIHPDDKKRYKDSVEEAIRTRTPWSFEGRLITPQGKIKWWKGIARLSEGKNGEIIFNGILIDFTDRQFYEEELRYAQAKLKRANQSLEEMSRKDSLTNIANRRSFDERIREEWKRAYRSNSHLSVIFIDIDDFKAFNDHYGHLKGDECLKRVAQALRESLQRSTDFVARLGGEEFVAILPETDAAGAMIVAEKMCRHIAEKNIPHEACSHEHRSHVTISAGVASTNPSQNTHTMHELLELADQALYEAKNNGKNQVKQSE